jgi:hypothetical protein
MLVWKNDNADVSYRTPFPILDRVNIVTMCIVILPLAVKENPFPMQVLDLDARNPDKEPESHE